MRPPLSFLGFAGALVLATAPLAAQKDAQSRLWDAAMLGDTVALVKALADGAKVDSLDVGRSRNGRRALNWAAINNRVPAINLLLANGAAVNSQNLTGFSPLHHAAEKGSLEAARALLAAGADPLLGNAAGNTPADVARELGYDAVAALIESAAKEKKTQP